MLKKIAQLSNLFFILFFIPIAVGLALLVFDIGVINLLNFQQSEIKVITIILNAVGIFSIKGLEYYFKSIKSEEFSFDKKLAIYKIKMLSGIAIIYLLEIINALAYLSTGDKTILIIYFLMGFLLLIFLPNKKKIEQL